MATEPQTLTTTLDGLRRELAEHGDRIAYFSPYIPLTMTHPNDQPVPPGYVRYGNGVIANAEQAAYADRVNSSGERYVWLSQMIRDIAGLDRILDECQQ